MSAESTALLALEKGIRKQIAGQLDTFVTKFGAQLAVAVRDGKYATAGELISDKTLHAALTSALKRIEERTTVVTRTGYASAARLARIVTAKQLKALGHDAPTALPDLGGFIDSVLADVRSAFGSALFDLQDDLRAAFDGVTGDGATPARVLTTNAALKRAARRLAVRANAAGVTALHRGFSDAQLAMYGRYQDINPFTTLRKRWQVQAADPCLECAALDGTSVPIGYEFDRDAAATPTRRALPVYRDLHGPPRHPNCRCRLVLEAGTAQ